MLDKLIFMAWYNMSSCDYSDFFTVTTCANTVSNNILMPSMLMVIFVISMIGITYVNKSVFRALAYSGFLCSVLSIFLTLMNMLNSDYMYVCFLVTGIGILATWLSEAPS